MMKPVYLLLSLSLMTFLMTGCSSREHPVPSPSTVVPPTATHVPPTATPIPPTATSIPPTPTIVPSTLEDEIFSIKTSAQQILANQLQVSIDVLDLVHTEKIVWPNTSLGCPKSGMMYALSLIHI